MVKNFFRKLLHKKPDFSRIPECIRNRYRIVEASLSDGTIMYRIQRSDRYDWSNPELRWFNVTFRSRGYLAPSRFAKNRDKFTLEWALYYYMKQQNPANYTETVSTKVVDL